MQLIQGAGYPGGSPTDVGKVVRRIVIEAILATMKKDIIIYVLEADGPLQVLNFVLGKMLAVKLQSMQCVQCLLMKLHSVFYWWIQVLLL